MWDCEQEGATGIVEAGSHTDRALQNAPHQPIHGGVEDGEVDFLDLLSSGLQHHHNDSACGNTGNETGTSKRSLGQTGRKFKKQRPEDQGENLEQVDQSVNRDNGEDLLGDPGVSAFLDAEDVNELKKVVMLCEESSKSSDLATWRSSVRTTCSDSESDADGVVYDASLFQEGDQAAAETSASSSSFQNEAWASI